MNLEQFDISQLTLNFNLDDHRSIHQKATKNLQPDDVELYYKRIEYDQIIRNLDFCGCLGSHVTDCIKSHNEKLQAIIKDST